jgi:ketopantoate reductase
MPICAVITCVINAEIEKLDASEIIERLILQCFEI